VRIEIWGGVSPTPTDPRKITRASVNCSYSYMIDNVMLLLTGTLHNRPIAELLPKCHPLGNFDQMETVTFATTIEELYSAVLVDTPIGRLVACLCS